MVSCRKSEQVILPPRPGFGANRSILESAPVVDGCNCKECVENREQIHRAERPTVLRPGVSSMYVASYATMGLIGAHYSLLKDSWYYYWMDAICRSALFHPDLQDHHHRIRSFHNPRHQPGSPVLLSLLLNIT
jgi:hypothetical protein